MNEADVGWFHKWANIASNGEVITVGIVEDREGMIHCISPDKITFKLPMI